MKLVFVLIGTLALTACASESGPNLDLVCNSSSGTRQAVKNNTIYREEIKKDFKECISLSNKNRDVVYNDSNEVVKTCRNAAYNMNGGVNPDNYFYNYIAEVEKSLYSCGEIK